MNAMLVRFAVAIAIVVGSLSLAPPASACSCPPQPPAAEALARSAAVFEAKVVAIEPLPGRPLPSNQVTLEVQRRWKGATDARIQVVTRESEAACGYPFQKSATYLVYATELPPDSLEVHLCSRTRELADAAEDIAALGNPLGRPTPSAAPAASTGSGPGAAVPSSGATPGTNGCNGGCALAPDGGTGAVATWLFLLAAAVNRPGRRRCSRSP